MINSRQSEQSELEEPLLLQECIPVGCVPPAAVPVCCGGRVSASVHAGIHPLPPGCVPGDPLGQTPQHPLWVWAWRPPT